MREQQKFLKKKITHGEENCEKKSQMIIKKNKVK